MSNLDQGLPEWLSYLLKVLFIMIFPLQFYITDILEILVLPSSGLLYPPVLYIPDTLFDFSYTISVLSYVLRNFVVGLVIAFPGIYYSYKLSRTPLRKSSWILGIGFAAIIYFITLGLVLFLSLSTYDPYGGYNTGAWGDLYNDILYYPTLVMAVFIILPLVIRQSVIISVPSDLHYYSVRDIESTPKFNLSREKILSGIFWLFMCFAPYTINYDIYNWSSQYMATSFMMDYRIGSNWYILPDTATLYLTGQIAMLPNIPFFALLFLFNFIFVRDVYRYLRRLITTRRLFAMGLFSSLFPMLFALSTGGLIGILIGGYLAYLPLPIPILQMVGLVMVRLHRPHIVQSERVWKGDRTTMWWETDGTEGKGSPMWWENERRRREGHVQPLSTPEKPNRHREEVITVPIGYRFLSRLRRLKSKDQSTDEN